jgi:hypothetical protein
LTAAVDIDRRLRRDAGLGGASDRSNRGAQVAAERDVAAFGELIHRLCVIE